MSRRITFTDDDMRVIFRDHMLSSGFLQEDQEIVGFEFRTKRIKKDGDFYKDPADPNDPDDQVEVVRKVIVLVK